MNGSATSSMRMVVMSRVSQPMPFERVLQGQAVDDRGGHAHVMGGRFLDHVEPRVSVAPRRILPPPTTIASWTPARGHAAMPGWRSG